MRKINKRLFIIVFGLFMCLTSFILIDNKDELKELFDPDSVVVNSQDNNGIKLAKYSTDGSSITVVATIDEDVTNRNVSWSLEWASSNSESVNNFVSISNSSDTLTCTITFKKAFTTQIILTCTSQSDTSVKATATIDYVGRNIQHTINTNAALGTESTSASLFRTITFNDLKALTFDKKSTTTSSGGTLNGTVTYTMKTFDDGNYHFHLNTTNGSMPMRVSYMGSNKVYDSVKSFVNSKGLSMKTYLDSVVADNQLGIEVNYTLTYGGETFASGSTTLWYSFDWNILEVYAENVTLDDSQIIF